MKETAHQLSNVPLTCHRKYVASQIRNRRECDRPSSMHLNQVAGIGTIPYTGFMLIRNQKTSASFKILSAYTGLESIDAVLDLPRAKRLLWLEILFNDQLDLTLWEQHLEVQAAYRKACRWYTTYRSLIHSVVPRNPLPQDFGTIDHREYRTFAEALRFVAH